MYISIILATSLLNFVNALPVAEPAICNEPLDADECIMAKGKPVATQKEMLEACESCFALSPGMDDQNEYCVDLVAVGVRHTGMPAAVFAKDSCLPDGVVLPEFIEQEGGSKENDENSEINTDGDEVPAEEDDPSEEPADEVEHEDPTKQVDPSDQPAEEVDPIKEPAGETSELPVCKETLDKTPCTLDQSLPVSSEKELKRLAMIASQCRQT